MLQRIKRVGNIGVSGGNMKIDGKKQEQLPDGMEPDKEYELSDADGLAYDGGVSEESELSLEGEWPEVNGLPAVDTLSEDGGLEAEHIVSEESGFLTDRTLETEGELPVGGMLSEESELSAEDMLSEESELSEDDVFPEEREMLTEELFSEEKPPAENVFLEEEGLAEELSDIEKPVIHQPTVRISRVLIWTGAMVVTAVAVALMLLLLSDRKDSEVDSLLEESMSFELETQPPTEEETEPANVVPRPDIDEQLLTVNEFSRPGEKVDAIDYVVIHYLANPKTTAQQNHDYFESLKDLQNVSMSANFIVGLEGEIIECVPPGEIAYASNSMNHLSVSIENCHLDTSGRFTEQTYESLVKLTAWVVGEYQLDREHIIRHYDVTGKECPLFFVENEDKWEEFRDDVMNYIKECEEDANND